MFWCMFFQKNNNNNNDDEKKKIILFYFTKIIKLDFFLNNMAFLIFKMLI